MGTRIFDNLGFTCHSLPPWSGVQPPELMVPISSELWAPFATVDLHLFPLDVRAVFFFPSNFARWAFLWIFHHAWKSRSFVGSRTLNLKYFRLTSEPELYLQYRHSLLLLKLYNGEHSMEWIHLKNPHQFNRKNRKFTIARNNNLEGIIYWWICCPF